MHANRNESAIKAKVRWHNASIMPRSPVDFVPQTFSLPKTPARPQTPKPNKSNHTSSSSLEQQLGYPQTIVNAYEPTVI